jgi:hypothetical protein
MLETETNTIYALGSTIIEGLPLTILHAQKSLVLNVYPSKERFAVDGENSLMYFTNSDEPPLFSVFQVDVTTMSVSMARRDNSDIGGPSGKIFVVGKNQIVISGRSIPGDNMIWKVIMTAGFKTQCFKLNFYHAALLISDGISKFAVSVFEEIDSASGIKSYITLNFDSLEEYTKFNVTQPLPKSLGTSFSNNTNFGLYVDNFFYIADVIDTQIYVFSILPSYLLGLCIWNDLQGVPRLLSFSYGIERFFILSDIDSRRIMMMVYDEYFYIFVIDGRLTPLRLDMNGDLLLYVNSTSPTYKDIYTLDPKNINFALDSKLANFDIWDGGAFYDDEFKYQVVEFSSYEINVPKSEDFVVKTIPQVFSPIVFDLDVFQKEVVRDKEVNITTSYTYTWQQEYMKVEYSIKAFYGMKLPKHMNINTDNLGNIWSENGNSLDQVGSWMTISDYVVEGPYPSTFLLVTKINNKEYYKPIILDLRNCFDFRWNFCPDKPGICTKWQDRYILGKKGTWELETPRKTFIVCYIVIGTHTILWSLVLLRKLPLAFYWSFINFYQTVGMLLIYKYPINKYIKSNLVNFISVFFLPYAQILWPPITILTTYYYSEVTSNGQMKTVYRILKLFWFLLFMFWLNLKMFFKKIKEYLMTLVKHNYSTFLATTIFSIYYEEWYVKHVFMSICILSMVFFGIIVTKQVLFMAIYGDEGDLLKHNSEFKYLKWKDSALFHHFLLMLKKTIQMIIIMRNYYHRYAHLNYMIFPLIAVEWIWALYTYCTYPYKKYSLNRIEVLNSLLLIAIYWTFSIVFKRNLIGFGGDIGDYLIYMMVPYPYLAIGVHFLIIKVFYKEKQNNMTRRQFFPTRRRINNSYSIVLDEYAS